MNLLHFIFKTYVFYFGALKTFLPQQIIFAERSWAVRFYCYCTGSKKVNLIFQDVYLLLF